MANLLIKNGKFYNKEGEIVPLEFGNVEQIRAIKEHEQKIEELKGDGYEIEVDFEVTVEASAKFRCTCGSWLFFTVDADEEDDISCFEGYPNKKCGCGCTYELEVDDYVLLVKLVN